MATNYQMNGSSNTASSNGIPKTHPRNEGGGEEIVGVGIGRAQELQQVTLHFYPPDNNGHQYSSGKTNPAATAPIITLGVGFHQVTKSAPIAPAERTATIHCLCRQWRRCRETDC